MNGADQTSEKACVKLRGQLSAYFTERTRQFSGDKPHKPTQSGRLRHEGHSLEVSATCGAVSISQKVRAAGATQLLRPQLPDTQETTRDRSQFRKLVQTTIRNIVKRCWPTQLPGKLRQPNVSVI
jgi:hypothetical protein